MAASTIDVAALTRWLTTYAEQVTEHRDELTKLDQAIGDGDHGSNLHRGMQAVVAKLADSPPADPAALFKAVGMTLVSNVGGASGPLFGTLFLRMAQAAGDASVLDAATLGAAFRAGLEGVVARGKAEAGDKTLYDALAPASAAFDSAVDEGADLTTALRRAADAAAEGRDATTPMVARKGRASYLGERSAGHLDPGATSLALLLETAASTLR